MAKSWVVEILNFYVPWAK